MTAQEKVILPEEVKHSLDSKLQQLKIVSSYSEVEKLTIEMFNILLPYQIKSNNTGEPRDYRLTVVHTARESRRRIAQELGYEEDSLKSASAVQIEDTTRKSWYHRFLKRKL